MRSAARGKIAAKNSTTSDHTCHCAEPPIFVGIAKKTICTAVLSHVTIVAAAFSLAHPNTVSMIISKNSGMVQLNVRPAAIPDT